MAMKDLNKLIKNMSPELSENEYVFCTINQDVDIKFMPKMIFREKEGTTLILEKKQADEYNLEYASVWKLITLNVNSDLEAVGFLAKITEVLANEEISVNAVSAYYHDHLFVPTDKSEQALEALTNLHNS
jgi:hypothetical protein